MASGHVNRAQEAEHMAAPTNTALVKKVLANSEPSTYARLNAPERRPRCQIASRGGNPANARTCPMNSGFLVWCPLASLRQAGAMADFARYLLIFLALKSVPRGAIYGTSNAKKARIQWQNRTWRWSTSHR